MFAFGKVIFLAAFFIIVVAIILFFVFAFAAKGIGGLAKKAGKNLKNELTREDEDEEDGK